MSDQKYYIISKFEFVNNAIVETYVGYTMSEQDANLLNYAYQTSYVDWVQANKDALSSGQESITTFFNTIPHVHSAGITTNYLDGFDVPLITDINSL